MQSNAHQSLELPDTGAVSTRTAPAPALVLIVEDNPVHLAVLSSVLLSDGLEVAVATDGEGALELASRAQPEVILLDALMRGLNGFDACACLKADPTTRSIPVIFMTALAEAQFRLQGFSVGAVDYVTKPFETTELLARVKTQVSLRRATRALEAQNATLSGEIRERLSAQEALAEAKAQLLQDLVQRKHAEAAKGAARADHRGSAREAL